MKISGYTTLFNVDATRYPYKESMQQALKFCNELIVGFGENEKFTEDKEVKEYMQKWASLDTRIKLYEFGFALDNPGELG